MRDEGECPSAMALGRHVNSTAACKGEVVCYESMLHLVSVSLRIPGSLGLMAQCFLFPPHSLLSTIFLLSCSPHPLPNLFSPTLSSVRPPFFSSGVSLSLPILSANVPDPRFASSLDTYVVHMPRHAQLPARGCLPPVSPFWRVDSMAG